VVNGERAARPLDDAERDALEALLDAVPAPLEPLDVVMLDGFLCGIVVQPERVPPERWLAHVTDADGRPLPPGFDATRLHTLALRRHAELESAIRLRHWFDPWVFELEDEAAGESAAAVYPWVAGLAAALETFPALMRREGPALAEALALLYRHLDRDDLEDADELLEAIDELGPATDLAEAVEDLVRATLLLADVAGVGAASAPIRSRGDRRRRPSGGRASNRRGASR
jgi:uncharacterized protein